MTAKKRKGLRRGRGSLESPLPGWTISGAVSNAINQGFVVGREVLVGSIPGIVVGYNIASFGQFIGSAFPLVVRTSMGVTKCGVDEVSLA